VYRQDLRSRNRFLLFLVGLCVLTSCAKLKSCAYEGINRDSWQHPEKVIASLGIPPGAVVADLGSGGGYFTFRLAQTVGPKGKVYAVDVDEGLNRELSQRAQKEGFQNIEVILASAEDPRLPESGVDLIFTSNTYHHLRERTQYFANLKKYLRPGARIAIIDFNQEGWLQSLGHYTPGEVIKKELSAAGYRLEREFDFLPKQNFLIFALST